MKAYETIRDFADQLKWLSPREIDEIINGDDEDFAQMALDELDRIRAASKRVRAARRFSE